MEANQQKQIVWVLHGPNLNRLGSREPGIYGVATLEDINADLERFGRDLGIDVSAFQSNHEGELVGKIQDIAESAQGVIINPAAYTHTSIAIRDALLLLDMPIIEIHLSNIYKREPFRHRSLISDIATGTISGLGPYGYRLALDAMANLLTSRS